MCSFTARSVEIPPRNMLFVVTEKKTSYYGVILSEFLGCRDIIISFLSSSLLQLSQRFGQCANWLSSGTSRSG